MSQYRVTVSNNNITVDNTTVKYEISQSRTGGQGTKGDSMTSFRIDDGSLIGTFTRADGSTYEVNAGSFDTSLDLDNLQGVTVVNSQEGDILQFNATSGEYENHRLTTTRLLDVDNTNQTDGAALIYDSATQKYQSTNRIEKSTTHIIGGSF